MTWPMPETLDFSIASFMALGLLMLGVAVVYAKATRGKADGAANYASTDLATILYRSEHFKADASLYVVDKRQGDHFEQLFLTAQKWFAKTGRPTPRLALGLTLRGSASAC